MNTIHRLIVASLVSVGIASALSVVPKLDGKLGAGAAETPVFRPDSPVSLSNRNLVDVFAKLSLHLELAHVEWNDTILSVDLRTKPGEALEPIYDDLYALAELGFTHTRNVKQLLVRVMEQPAGRAEPPQLLLAMDAKRSDLGAEPEAGITRKGTKEQYLSSHFSLTYTHKWLDRHRR
ncbi:hypothetical protein [Paenibacillus sp. GYB003]|uniref:hypothetical protein n=1 Tax=Paenibacillus sp. GYB003 TaxID=2994392 RepID=UPI002F965806